MTFHRKHTRGKGNMETYRLLVAAWLVLATAVSGAPSEHSFRRYFVNETLRLCEVSDFCTRNASFTSSVLKTPCCEPCDCDAMCTLRGNCCPDVDHDTNRTVHDVNGKCTANFFSSIPEESVAMSTLEMYYAVTSCPIHFRHVETKRRCYKDVPEAFEEVVLVSDDNGIVYKNEFCAKCNGVYNFEVWTIDVRCKDDLRHDGHIPTPTFANLMRTGCMFWSKRPLHLNYAPPQCYIADVTRCNVTGLWDVYDADIERACDMAIGPPHVKQTSVSREHYTNVFCCICNHQAGELIKQYCFTHRGSSEVYISIKYTMLLDGRVLSIKDEQELTKHNCRQSEIYDKFTSMCRSLICPLGKLTMNGECVDIIYSIEGFSFSFSILIHATKAIPRLTQKKVYAILDEVRRVLALESKDCAYCSAHVYDNIQGYDLVFNFTYEASSLCPITEIVNMTLRFFAEPEHVTVPIRGENITFLCSLGFDVKYNQYASFADFLIVSPYRCKNPWVLGRNYDCPRIVVSRADLVAAFALKRTKLDRNDRRYGHTFTLSMDDSVEVCVEDYFGANDGLGVTRNKNRKGNLLQRNHCAGKCLWDTQVVLIASVLFAVRLVDFD